MNLDRLQSLVVNDDLPMSPPPSSFGGFSPIPAIGLFFLLVASSPLVRVASREAPLCSLAWRDRPAMAPLDRWLNLPWIVQPFDERLKSALEYQAFRHQLIRQQLIRFTC
jgi:hypothetical protein